MVNNISPFTFSLKEVFMTLDLSVFEKALNNLKLSIEAYKNDSKNDMIRDSVIQRFEYTYSFTLKIMERFLRESSINKEDVFTFNSLIRTASQNNLLLGNLENWDVYRKKRNMTSHTYDEKKALEVISIMDDFIKEVEFLLNKLKEHNAD